MSAARASRSREDAFARSRLLRADALRAAVELGTQVGPMRFHGHDRVITPAVRETGVWEPELTAAVRGLLRPGMRTADVGANVGWFVRVMAEAVGPTGGVVAIEPDPANLALLEANVARAPAPVHVVPGAAWAVPGTLRLTRATENTGDHRIEVRAFERETLEVQALVLDDVLAAGVDLLVLDVQASEHLVLRGAQRMLRRRPAVVLAEFWPAGLEEAGTAPLDVLREYREAGFAMRLVEGDHPGGRPGAPIEELLDAVLAIDPERFGTLELRLPPRRPGWRGRARR